MQIKFLVAGFAAALWLAAALPATAQEAMPYHGLSEQERQEVRERWDQMSEEERARVRRQADEYWAGLSEEEREARREELRQYQGQRSRAHGDGAGMGAMTPEQREAHRAEMQKRWEAMTPAEREAHRQQMRNPKAADPHQGVYGTGYGKSQGEADPKGTAKDTAKSKDKSKDKKD
jgi:hypothetical protein